jgi:hypothetical protein
LILRLKPRNHRDDFETQITKPQLPALRLKPENPSHWFEAKPDKTIGTDFKARPEKNHPGDFEVKPLTNCRP